MHADRNVTAGATGVTPDYAPTSQRLQKKNPHSYISVHDVFWGGKLRVCRKNIRDLVLLLKLYKVNIFSKYTLDI